MTVLSLFQPAMAEAGSAEQGVVEEVIDTVDTATYVADRVVTHIPILAVRLLEVALVLLIGALFLRLGKAVIEWLFRRYRRGNMQNERRINTFHSVFISVFHYLLFFTLVAIILSIFGVKVKTVMTMASIGGIAVGFASQTLIKDVIFGLYIWAEGSIGVGDYVRINDMDGAIESISLRKTVIQNYNGNTYTIPNGEIRTITNMSIGFKRAIVDIRCPYEENQIRLLNIIQEEVERAVREIDGITGEADIMNIFSFEPDAVLVRVTVQCKVQEHWRIEREIRARIKNRFDTEGIVMPHYAGFQPERKA